MNIMTTSSLGYDVFFVLSVCFVLFLQSLGVGLYAVADVYVHSETINDCKLKNFASYNCAFFRVYGRCGRKAIYHSRSDIMLS